MAEIISNLAGVLSPDNPLHVQDAGPLPVTQRHGVVAVAVAGTRVQLSAASVPLVARHLVVRMTDGQSGFVYVGGPTVSAVNGYPLVAGESVPLAPSDLSDVWIDASVNGNSVSYIGS